MNRNRSGFLRAVAAVVVGVTYCVAAGNASATKETTTKVLDQVLASAAQQWVDVLLKAEEGSETTWFLLPNADGGEISADEALAHLSEFLDQAKGDHGAMNWGALGMMGVLTAIVPSKHGVAPKGLHYELKGLGDQWNLPAIKNPWVVVDYGATPVEFGKAAFEAGDVQWGPAPVATLFRAGAALSPGEKFQLTELPVQKAWELLKGKGFEVVTQETPAAFMGGEPGSFTPEVEACITRSEESSTPILECYNLHRGLDPDALWFEEVYQAAEKDRFNYGPFVATPLERVNQAWVE